MTLFRVSRRSGFTLIELLVVMAIIALLIALLLPVLSRARQRAWEVQCSSNLRQFVTALLVYDQEAGSFPRGRYNLRNGMLDKVHNRFRDEYNINAEIAYCPSGAQVNHTYRWENEYPLGHMGYWYLAGKADHTSIDAPATSFPNGWKASNFPQRASGFVPAVSASRAYRTPWDHARLQPSQQFMMMDVSYWNLTSAPDSHLPQTPSHAMDPSRSGGANTSFMDGHVEWANFVPGVSWKVQHDGGDPGVGFWTPNNIQAPVGAVRLTQ